jgi:multidrug efflux pump subunit AcrA (membrane-fusion protein)
MKKIVLGINMLAVMALVSCKPETAPPPPPVPEPQVIVVQPTPPPSAPPKKAEKDGTTISVGSNGVEVSTKKGDKKTVIDVKDGKGTIEIKK